MHFRNDIQGLRALAFIFVFIFHLNSSWLPGGFIGVDMFFVISGYLITSIMMHQKAKGTFNFLSFYEKRIKRIAPAYYFLLLFVAVAGFFIYLQVDIKSLIRGLKYSGIFASNILFSSGESYFGAKTSENPFLHTWSLAIEMQFYLLLPLILIFIKDKYLPVVVAFLLIAITGYSTYELIVNDAKSSIYFSLTARIPEFLVGVYFSLVFSKRKVFPQRTGTIVSILGSVVLVSSLFLIDENSYFPGTLALLPCLGIGLILISGDNLVTRSLSNKVLVYFGELSYSLYLWHWPIMAFFRYKNDAYEFEVWEILFITISTFIASWVSYKLVESKFRNLNNFGFIKFLSPAVILLVMGIVVLPKLSDVNPDNDAFFKPNFGTISHYNDTVEVFGSENPKYSRILLIGDSHALVIKSFLDYIGKRNDFSFKTITSNSFPALDGVIMENDYDNKKFYDYSVSIRKTTKENIESSNVIILNSNAYKDGGSFIKAIELLISSLRDDQSLILIKTFPSVDRNPVRVNGTNITKKTSKDFKLVDKPESSDFERIVQDNENVYSFDLKRSTIFKDAPFHNDTLLYYDANHLNLYGSISLAKDLEKDFMELLLAVMMQKDSKM